MLTLLYAGSPGLWPAYQAALAHAIGASERDLVIVEAME